MPWAAPTPCRQPGCGRLVSGGRFCPDHKRQRQQQQDRDRGTAAQRGYGSKWQKASKAFLAAHPLCIDCEAEGRTEPATVVDHDPPHKGDRVKFWDSSTWRPRCKPHHDRKTATEDGGFGH